MLYDVFQYNKFLLVMSINEKMQEMSVKFKELKTTQIPLVKRMLIDQIRKIAGETEAAMQLAESSENLHRRRQIASILTKCAEIEKTAVDKQVEDIGKGGRMKNIQKQEKGQSAQISKMALRSVVMQEIRSSQLMIKPEQIDDIVQRMQKNRDIMQEIEQMVHQQGNDLEKIDEYLEIAYENTENANKELSQAVELQHQTRRMKFKLAVSGFFAALGYKILGLPGMVMGLFFGSRS